MEKDQQRLISRDTYRRVKGMNREQISEYATNIYIRGYEAGRKASTPDVLLRTFREVLISVDSIGPARADAIMKKLSDVFGVSEGAPQEAEENHSGDERLTPRRPFMKVMDGFDAEGASVLVCPCCEHPIVNQWARGANPAFCQGCGQAIDWTEKPKNDEEAG